MAATLRIDILTNALRARREIDSVDGSAGKLGGGLKKLGAVVAGAFAVGAVVSFGKEVYNAASAVQQSFGAVDSVFKKNSAEVKKWASSAASDVGLAKSEYANLAALLGSQLTNMGRSTGEAAKQTDSLIKMGADLAATYGGSVADAVSAVSSVLKGETDPIERYGISIKAADISARLAAEGQDELTGNAKKAATATAALDLITRQASAAQGAFGREANTAAGQQERARAQLENLKATIGSALLPVMTKTFGYINSTVFPAVARVGKELRTEFGPQLASVGKFLSTEALPAARKFGKTLAEDLAPNLRNVGRFIARDVVPAAKDFAHWFVVKIVPQVQKTVMPVVGALGRAFGGIAKTLDDNSENLSKLGKFLKFTGENLAKLLPIIGKVVGTGIDVLAFSIKGVVTVVSELVGWIDSAIDKLKALGDAIANNPISKGVGKIGGAIGGLFAAGPLAGVGAGIAGRAAPTGGLQRLATASTTTAAAMLSGASGGASGPALFGGYVDARRSASITVTGALDPVAVARQIEALLRRHDVIVGRASTFAPASGWVG